MDKWYKIYKDRINTGYSEYFNVKYEPFIKEIIKNSYDYFYEIGCGAGFATKSIITKNVYYKGFNLYDINENMINLSKENLPYKNIQTFVKGFSHIPKNFKKNSVVYSHGVIEHLGNRQIQRIIEKFNNVDQVHYVPTDFCERKTTHCERLLSKEYWYLLTKADELTEFDDKKGLIIFIKKKV